MNAATLNSTGDSEPHNNLAPYLVIRFLICAEGGNTGCLSENAQELPSAPIDSTSKKSSPKNNQISLIFSKFCLIKISNNYFINNWWIFAPFYQLPFFYFSHEEEVEC